MTNIVAELFFWDKVIIQDRYILEMRIYRLEGTERYPEGVKYGLILFDVLTRGFVLMDNHYPKGHHVHVNDREMAYHYVDQIKLLADFRRLVLKNMGVRI